MSTYISRRCARLFLLSSLFVSGPALAASPATAAADHISFEAAPQFPTAANPSSVAGADFDGDGKKDLVVASYTSNTVAILRAQGSSFVPGATLTTGANPVAVAAEDLNGDGSADLAVANYSSKSISIFSNDGHGALSLRTTLTTGTNPHSVAVADLNGDAAQDLVVANFGSASISVFRGDGSGGFAAVSTFAAGTQARMARIVDLNGDTKLDVAVANYGANSVSILLGNGNGGFAPKSDIAVSGNPVSVAVADLNQDGKQDLVTANYTASSVSVLIGNGAGAFAVPVRTTVGANPVAISSTDLNGDAKPDVVAANYGSHSVSVLSGNGTGGLSSAATYTVGVNPYALALEDIDGDAVSDLAIANFGSASVSVMRGLPGARFVSAPSVTVGSNPMSVSTGDLNRDGKLDVVSARTTAASIAVSLGDGAGGFASPVGYSVGTTPYAVTLGDLNADGLLDAVTANYGSDTVSVLIGDGTGRFGGARAFPAGSRPSALALGDVDGDGALDIAVANGSGVVTILRNDAGATFATASTTAVGAGPRALALGDLNGDGKLDVVTANSSANSASAALGNGAGGFGAGTPYPAGSNPTSVVLGRFDADAALDLAVANYGSHSVTVRSGNGGGGFGSARTFGVGRNPQAVVTADFDADGNLDLAVAAAGSNAVSILEGDGAGGFAPERSFGAGRDPSSLAVGRFDADEMQDIVTANYSANAISLLVAGDSGWGPAPLPTLPGCETPSSGWTECIATASPGAPGAPSLAYDPVRGNSVLFGGCKQPAAPRTTVTFSDGTTWTSGSQAEALKPFCVSQSEETWTFEDGTWTKRAVSGPHARSFAHMTFDKTTGWVILSGGLYTAIDQPQAPPGSKSCWGSSVLLDNVTDNPDGPNTFTWAYTSITSVTAADASVPFNGKPLNAYCFNDTWAWTGTEWRELKTSGAPTARFDGAIASDQTAACTPADFADCSTSAGLVTLFGGCQSIGLMGNHGDTMHPHHWECSRYAGDYGTSTYIQNKTSGVTRANACETSGDICERKISIGDTWEWRGNLSGAPDAQGNNGRWVRTCPDSCTPMKTPCKDGVDGSGNAVNAPGVDWDSQSFCAPFMRDGTTMVFNPSTKAYQLFGGWYYNPQWVYNGIHGDSWEWHPTGSCTTDAGNLADDNRARPAPCWQNVFATWKKANWSSPQPKNRAWGNSVAVPIDGAWQQMVYGGHGIVDGRNAGALVDAWTWREPDGCTDGYEIYDKTCWQPVAGSVVPPPRRVAAMTYDATAGVVVAYGGACDQVFDPACTTGARADTWLFKP